MLAKRWMVERTLAWTSRNRRLPRATNDTTRSAPAFVKLAMIHIMLRCLAVPHPESKLPVWALRSSLRFQRL